jgi:hypothetical protein
LGNHFVERASFFDGLVLLVPVVEILGTLEHGVGSSVDGVLDFFETGVQFNNSTRELDINFEEGLELSHVSCSLASFTDNTVLHGIQGVLSAVEKSLVQVPDIVALDLLGFFLGNRVNVGIQGIAENGSEEIIDSSFDFKVLGHQVSGVFLNEFLLHPDEFFQRKRLAFLRKVNQKDLGDGLEVVFNSVFNDIVDVNNQLFKLAEALVDVLQESIDIHGGPGQSQHTGSELEFEIFSVRLEDISGDVLHLTQNSGVFSQEVVELVVVSLELLFLKEDNLGAVGDFLLVSLQALGFSDQFKDVQVKVDNKGSSRSVVLLVGNDEGGLEALLCFFNIVLPVLEVPHLVDCELLTQVVVGTKVLLEFLGINGDG